VKTPFQPVGAEKVVAWWGEWISFHDFHLLSLPAAGSQHGELRIHGWTTDWTTTDAEGHFTASNNCVVTIGFRRIRSMKLSSEEIPAIIFELSIHRAPLGLDPIRRTPLHESHSGPLPR
jgi:hypothetical protein